MSDRQSLSPDAGPHSEALACAVCESRRLRRLGMIAPSCRPGFDRYEIIDCADCGVSFSHPRPSAQEIAELYESAGLYESDYGQRDAPWQRRQHALDLARIAYTRRGRLGRLLDVGCSYGLLLEVALDQGWDAYGVEADFAAAAIAVDRVGENRVLRAFVQDIPLEMGPFDAISMSHVFEHLVDHRNVVERLSRMLAPEGVLAIQAPQRRSIHTLRKGADHRPIEHPVNWTYRALNLELRRVGLRPRVAPSLWGTSEPRGRAELAKSALLAFEGRLLPRSRFGLKSTLEMHGLKDPFHVDGEAVTRRPDGL